MRVQFELNGEHVDCAAAGTARLSAVLREQCGARDVKVGCGAGDCGACTVLIDGEAYNACTVAAGQITGRQVETAAGLHRAGDRLACELTAAFHAQGAVQCGMCFPGMLTSAIALKRKTPNPSMAHIQDALGGVLCRCSGYRKLLNAVASTSDAVDSLADTTGAVGDSIPRIDGVERVIGEAQFGDDIAPRGTLVLKLLRSPHARAQFKFGDVKAWLKASAGIVDVITAADVPGVNCFGVIPGFEDQPVFAQAETRYRGEAVAAVVGQADAMASFDLRDFPVTWTALNAVSESTAAQRDGAPQLHAHAQSNVMCRGRVVRGDVTSAFEGAAHVITGRFRSGFVEHAYIEPEAGYATFEAGRVSVYGCTQAPVMDQEALAAILGLDSAEVRIVPTQVGGGFGSKLDLSFQPYIARAAMRLGRAVRVCYTREESMQSTTKRHPSDIGLRVAVDADGKLCGFDFTGDFNTGAYASWGPTVANRVPVHASGPYAIPNYRALSAGVYTHNPPAGAFRGFGVPQAAIAQEV
ncbi:MAG: molybdopterin cofactor-binding domain-containing protein, partial [Pseudomonadota bacterium]